VYGNNYIIYELFLKILRRRR